MEMESLDGKNLFFCGLAERPKEAPASTVEKKVYDGELVMYSRIKLLKGLRVIWKEFFLRKEWQVIKINLLNIP
jgi:hypothetical protein